MKCVKCLIGLVLFLGMVSGAEPAGEKKPETDRWGRVIRGESGALFNYLSSDRGTTRLRLGKNRKVVAKTLLNGGNTVDLLEVPAQNPLSVSNFGFSDSSKVRLEWRRGVFGSNIGGSNICIADIDQDSNLEIVLGGSTTTFGADNFWHVIRYDPGTSSYRDIWVSDYYFTSISRIVVADLDKNGTLEIVLGLGNGSIQIVNGSTLQVENACATPAGDINDLAIGDVDRDGANEIVFCNDSSIFVYDALTLSLEWNSGSYGGRGIAIGNVDRDLAVEIVTSRSGNTGYVVDGSSHVLEWEYAGGFGSIVRLEDIDGDYMKEIVGANDWDYITAFDADIKSPKWQITADLDIDSLRVMDIDNDSVLEILYGDGQWGSVYCINSQTQNLEWSIDNPEHGTTDIGAADVDGDGTIELLWGSGASSTGEDHLYVADSVTQTIEWWNEHLDPPFQAFDVGDVDGDVGTEIVMGSYESGSGYDSGVVLIYDASTHTCEWSSGPLPDASTWTGLQSIKVADVDQDGDNEYLVGTADLYDGLILCYEGDTHLLKWSTPNYGSTFYPIEVCDVDNDGQMEVIGGNNGTVYVFNGADGTEEWHSINLGSKRVYGLRVIDVDADGRNEIIAGIEDGTIWIFDGVTKSLDGQIVRNDTLGLDVFDIDSDGVQEILVGTDEGKVVIYGGVTYAQEAEWQRSHYPIDALKVMTSSLFAPNPAILLGSGGTLRVIKYPSLSLFWESPLLGTKAGPLNNIVVSDIDSDTRNEIIISGSHALNIYELQEVPPVPWITDYNGDGTSDLAIFRPAAGLWAVRGITRAYFGTSDDRPVPGDYTGDGTTDIAIFRESSGLWAVKGNTRTYFGGAGDIPVPGLYNNPSSSLQHQIGIFRPSSGLWAIKGITRAYFGGSSDEPVPGYYGPEGKKSIGVFRPTSGLWALKEVTRTYFGSSGDTPVPGDYNGNGSWDLGVFRPTNGLWVLKGVTRAYFGTSTDLPIPGGYRGDGQDYPGIFRNTNGLWVIQGVTRAYFGSGNDVPVTR